MNEKSLDKNLVEQAYISIRWLFESNQSRDKSIQKALKEFRENCEMCEIINPGILMAFAYISFVYPKEASVNGKTIDINISNFTVLEPKEEITANYLLKRIRNSIAHSNFSVSIGADPIITFKDNCRCKKNPFKAKIGCGNFGNFVLTYYERMKAQSK